MFLRLFLFLFLLLPQFALGQARYPSQADVRPQTHGLQTQDSTLGTIASESNTRTQPSDMMRTMLTASHSSRLPGNRISLSEALQNASSRREQAERVEAYWDLCSSVADYYLGLHEQKELRRLRAKVQRIGSAWEQAEREMGVRIETSQRAAVASQHRLASLMERANTGLGSLPLPGDGLHCGDYHTHYDQIFAGRQSAEGAELKELLPLRFEELRTAAQAVAGAETWLQQVATGLNASSDGAGVVKALELLALRRRAFVQIARDYNRRIARYTELATPGPLEADRLVAMLIKTDRRTNTATRPPQQPPYSRSSQNSRHQPPRTFSKDWSPRGQIHDEDVRAASTESTQTLRPEQSILVSPPVR